MYPRLALAGLLASTALAACSTNILKGPEPVCGAPIDRSAVLVLDMTGYEQQQDKITKAVQEQVGAYKVMTDGPVWIPKKNASRKSRSPASIVRVQSIAADWGCNLLILLDAKMARTELKTQARNEDVVWLVQAGMRGAP
jgi:hypothetical protein